MALLTKYNAILFGLGVLIYVLFNRKKIKFVTKLKPSKRELKFAEFAMNICKFVKSNSIVVTKDFSTIGIGAGQPSRVDSCKIAVEKAARELGMDPAELRMKNLGAPAMSKSDEFQNENQGNGQCRIAHELDIQKYSESCIRFLKRSISFR